MPGYFALSPTLCTCSPIRLCALETRDMDLPPPFQMNEAFFLSLFCLYEDGGVLLLRELSVSLWRGLPPYNGIKFKFKCGRDVKSTVGKKLETARALGATSGGFSQLSDHQNSGGERGHREPLTRARARARTHTHTRTYTRTNTQHLIDRRTACLYPL